LLGQEQSIVDFNAEVPDGAFQLGMPKRQLARAKIVSALVDQGNLRSPQAVRSIERWVEADQRNPAIESGIDLQANRQPSRLSIAAGALKARKQPSDISGLKLTML
jgi:hypothetical protein